MEQNKSKHIITPQSRELYELLKSGGVNAILEYWDGHKTIDIAIPNAHIFIEVDGSQHFIDPEQIERDFKRAHFSGGDDFDTIHIPNIIIRKYLHEVADAIIKVVTNRTTKTV